MTTTNELATMAASHFAAGRYGEAVAAYRAALNLAPANAGVIHNLGIALAAKGDFDEAVAILRHASVLQPRAAAPWLALGHLEFRRKRIEAGEAAFAHAAALSPGSVEAQYNLGYARHELGRFADAIPALETARRLDPADEQVWYQLFSTRLAQGEREAALADFLGFEKGAALTPFLFHAALDSVRGLGDTEMEERYLRRATHLTYGPKDTQTLAGILARLQYFDVTRTELLRLYRTYDALVQQRCAADAPLANPTRRPGDRVRIGYLSADFRQHVMGRLMQDVIGAHDRDRYAIHLYSLQSAAASDPVAASFRQAADRYIELPWPDDLAAARVIAADDCDVLVDLMGHTKGSRPEILAFKPARIIVTHLGYHGALGLSQVDFKLTDRHADVADAGDFQIERPLALGSCVMPFRRAEREPIAPGSRQALGVAADAVIFGEFVPLKKLSPRCLTLWRAILAEVPRGMLAFSPASPADHPAYIRQLEGSGIDASRVRFIARGEDESAERARYGLVDLVLDTVPYSGGDATTAALEAGVPVVTLVGTRQAERMSASILWHLGFDELVAATERDYVVRAIALASDRAQRARLSVALRASYAKLAPNHTTRYTRDLEAALDTAIASAARLAG
jgi:predicted O-linked N-acetylglucosamine transferase (SPINDLY family)